MDVKKFNPLTFLASVGAGGISIIPFAYMQYTTQHGKGLVTYSQMSAGDAINPLLLFSLSAIMIIFAGIHYALSIGLFAKWFKWMRSKEYYDMKAAPLKNAALMTPIISAAMSMNVLIGVVRFFVPSVSTNFQALMLPALIVWLGVWVWLMYMEISLLKISFTKEFDVNKISFGWLLHPFALSMVTVTGMGIAAMAKNHNIADTAVMLSMVSGTMGLFLFIVKLISIFKSHFVAKGIPERQFLPSFLIVVPIMTLFTISIFRFGHYMEHRFDFDMPWFFSIVVMVGFAFETWYLAFGLGMLKDYFKKDFFKNEYYVTLWAFICPFVAYAVLGSFLYKTFLATSIIEFVIYASMITSISMYGIVGKRAIQNRRMPKINSLSTSK